jgi:hypothetical protein
VSGIVCPLVSVRPCACWVAASCPPSVPSAAAHALRTAGVSHPEAISGWPAADQSPGRQPARQDTQTSVSTTGAAEPRPSRPNGANPAQRQAGDPSPSEQVFFYSNSLQHLLLLLFYINEHLPFQSTAWPCLGFGESRICQSRPPMSLHPLRDCAPVPEEGHSECKNGRRVHTAPQRPRESGSLASLPHSLLPAHRDQATHSEAAEPALSPAPGAVVMGSGMPMGTCLALCSVHSSAQSLWRGKGRLTYIAPWSPLVPFLHLHCSGVTPAT